MKNLRVLCAAFALASALAVPALGGEIGTGSPAPPSQPATASGEIGTGATGGEIGTGFTPDATEAAAYLTAAEVGLSLLRGVLSLV
jgi:hypothetical protein